MHLCTKNVAIAGARRARGVAAGADAEINLFRRGSRASRFFRAAGPHSRKNLDVARARRARAFEFERSVVSVGEVVSVKRRARARRASAVVARVEGCARATDGDARARPSTTTTTTTTTTDAVVARRRRRARVVVVVVVARGVVHRPRSRRARPKPHTPWTVQYLIFTSPVNAGTDCFCFVCRFISTCPTYSSVHTCIIYA